MVMPCMADETSDVLYSENINMTPQNSFSGYRKNAQQVSYPRLNSTQNSNIYRTYSYQNQQRAEMMKAKSVKDISSYRRRSDDNSPMSYGQFPQNRDSSDMMHMQQIHNGIQNMFMDF